MARRSLPFTRSRRDPHSSLQSGPEVSWNMSKELDDDFCSPKPSVSFPAAPRRPEKKGNVQSLPVISVPCSSLSSVLEKTEHSTDSKLSPLSDTCAICSKNLQHLNDLRKVAHVNKCLDAQESTTNHAKATEKWNNTIDCPMCGEPQPPGPHRAAHAKRCGKAHKIPPKELLKLMDIQSRLSDAKKRASMAHTKAQVPIKKEVAPPKLQGAPKSVFDENLQLAQAISASMSTDCLETSQSPSPQFTRLVDPNEKKRKRPRSYAVVELAPRSCKCEILEKVHNRFLEAFKVKKTNGDADSHTEVCRRRYNRTSVFMQYQTRLLDKLERLERLSDDLSHLFGNETTSDIQIQCRDGSLKAHRAVLYARTSMMGKTPSQPSISSIDVTESLKIVSSWLRYVYSGRIEWNSEDHESIQKLAELYGPDDLVPLCVRMKAPVHSFGATATSSLEIEPISTCSSTEEKKDEETATKTEITPIESSNAGTGSEIVVPKILMVDLNEPETAMDAESSQTMDLEDPLQGIMLANTSGNSSADSSCCIIEDNVMSVDQEVNQVDISAGKQADDVACTSSSEQREAASSSQEISGDLQITIKIPEELCTPQPSAAGKSPDVFEEKDGDVDANEMNAADDFSWNLTPLRPSAVVDRRSSGRQSLRNSGLRLSFDNAAEAPGANGDLEIFEPTKSSNNVTVVNIDDEPCLKEIPDPTPAENQNEQPDISYGNEYFNYHDPFMEPWYEPVEMSQQSVSQPLEIEDEATASVPKSPVHETSVTSRRGSKIVDSKESSNGSEKVATVDHQLCDNEVSSENSFTVRPNSPHFVPPLAHSTPAQPARKKAKFGSNVKILKTSDITPMPNYEGMTDEELKRELKKFGLKPMGRKRAVAMLKRIYDEVHPVIDPTTPTVRPLILEKSDSDTPRASRQAKTRNVRPLSTVEEIGRENDDPEDEDFVDFGDKTLNEPRAEPPEESMIDDTGILPTDLEGMTRTFLTWLRHPENDQLYNHLLSLQPVLIEELHLRMSRADSAVCCIPKKALANILDRLGVTFSLPQTHGGRRANGVRRAGKVPPHFGVEIFADLESEEKMYE
ncbi:hypothetical protein RB195_011914 [Necator americanus]|uniref:BTB domain-containing protein n=1 Tax=Necator americanus TaxID=51031 RepID=A0ABR1D691_NECAM